MSEKMVQVKLERWVSPSTSVYTTTWLDLGDKKFKIGDIIVLKDDESRARWVVKEIFDGADIKKENIHTDWPVGGLTK